MILNLKIIGLLGFGLILGTALKAEAAYIRGLDSFYDYYDQDFSPAEKDIVEEAFNFTQPFMGADGKQKAIEAGFRPFLYPLKGHGEHWFLPPTIGTSAVASMPTGLNFDDNNQLVAAFWTESKYSLPELFELTEVEPQALLKAYQEYKENYQTDVPSIFEPFGEQSPWHSHENTIFENLGTLNPESIEFTQSVSDQNFVNSLLNALSDENIVAAPFEQDSSLGYPPFNTLIVPGFYMSHLWLGLGNPTGLFANTHPDVSPNAIEEHLTFEDGVSDHHHSTDDHHSSQTVPEPSATIGLFNILFS